MEKAHKVFLALILAGTVYSTSFADVNKKDEPLKADSAADVKPAEENIQQDEAQPAQESANDQQSEVKEEISAEKQDDYSAEPMPADTYSEPLQEPAKPAAATLPKSMYSASSFIVAESWSGDGYITGEKDKRLLIATGDTVYISVGRQSIKTGTNCIVYRIAGKLLDHKSSAVLGNEVRRIAKIEVVDSVSKSAATAIVTVAFEPIEIGDIVVVVK